MACSSITHPCANEYQAGFRHHLAEPAWPLAVPEDVSGCAELQAQQRSQSVSAPNSSTERGQQEGYLFVQWQNETISSLCGSTLWGVWTVRTLVVATACNEQQRAQEQHTPEHCTQTCEPCYWHLFSLNFLSYVPTSHALGYPSRFAFVQPLHNRLSSRKASSPLSTEKYDKRLHNSSIERQSKA